MFLLVAYTIGHRLTENQWRLCEMQYSSSNVVTTSGLSSVVLYFLYKQLVFDIGLGTIVSGTIENTVLESEISFLSKCEESLYYFRFVDGQVTFCIDPHCLHCRSILICVGDPLNISVVRNCISIHNSSKVISISGLQSAYIALTGWATNVICRRS